MFFDSKTVKSISLASLIVSMPALAQDSGWQKVQKSNSDSVDSPNFLDQVADFIKDFDLLGLSSTMSESTGDSQ